MQIPGREHKKNSLLHEDTDCLLAKLHQIQAPDKFSALAAAFGWVEEEVPPHLITEIMERIKEEEGLIRRVWYITCCSVLFLVMIIFFSASKLFDSTLKIEGSQILIGCFWLVVSMGLSIPLLTGLLVGYRELEVEKEGGFAHSDGAKTNPYTQR